MSCRTPEERKPLGWLCAALLLACTLSRAAAAQGGDPLADARRALDRLDLPGARAALDTLGDDSSAQTLQLRALLDFHEGHYGAAAQHMQELERVESPLPPHLRELQRWIVAARDLREQMEQASAGDGRYRVYYEPRDRLLAVYALDALERADRALTRIFGAPVRGPIRVEIYPDPQALSQVSSLTTEHIETTGTVALSKWNRLMVTSPRALLRGYPWLDTVCHELVHMVLAELSANEAPVWVHEGLAKLMERTWRGGAPAPQLSPASEAALVEAARRDQLIPFEKLHPSIAMLPSQDAAALAFAQVATFMQTLYDRRGDAGIAQLTSKLAAGKDARDATGAVWGAGFADLETTWKRAEAKKPLRPDPPSLLKLRFKDSPDEHHDESLDVAEKRARRHVRLGDMMWTRGHKKAAALEYQRAHRYAPEDAVLASRLGRTAIEAGEPRRALDSLRQASARQPSYAPLRSLLGEALLLLGKPEEAREQLAEAIRLNPFDPTPHCGLAQLSPEDAWEAAVCAHLREGRPLALPDALAP